VYYNTNRNRKGERKKMKEVLFGLYALLWVACGLWAGFHVNDTNEKGQFKFQWRSIIFVCMLWAMPLVAKFCGLL
jgi:hypothetical protein